jgi:hypothetical protein
MGTNVLPDDPRCDALTIQIPIQCVMAEVLVMLGIVGQREVDLTRHQELAVVQTRRLHLVAAVGIQIIDSRPPNPSQEWLVMVLKCSNEKSSAISFIGLTQKKLHNIFRSCFLVG